MFKNIIVAATTTLGILGSPNFRNSDNSALARQQVVDICSNISQTNWDAQVQAYGATPTPYPAQDPNIPTPTPIIAPTQIPINPEQFRGGEFIGEFDRSKLNVVIAGIGFEDNASMVENLRTFSESFQRMIDTHGIRVNVVIYNQNFPISYQSGGRTWVINDYRFLNDFLVYFNSLGYPIDKLALAINSSDYGGTGSLIGNFSLFNEYALFIASHEILGHSIANLTDGYEDQFTLPQMLQSTEYVTMGLPTNPDLVDIMRQTGVQSYRIPNRVCKGNSVYSIGELGDAMDVIWTDGQLLQSIPFNPVQMVLLNRNIDQMIRSRGDGNLLDEQ